MTPRGKIIGVLPPLFFILFLAILEVGVARIFASFVSESPGIHAEILIVLLILTNGLVISLALFKYLKSKGFKVSNIQTFEVIAFSLTPIIAYNLLVIYFRNELVKIYVPIDPFGLGSLIFLNNLSVNFIIVHTSLWISVLLIYKSMLEKTVSNIKLRNILNSAVRISFVYVGLLISEYLIIGVLFLFSTLT